MNAGLKFAPQFLTGLIFLALALPLQAQVQDTFSQSSISVCNKGTVPVEVIVAVKTSDFPRRLPGTYYWNVQGTLVAPQDCTTVRDDDDPAYIGFGFADAKGEWGSGTVLEVPDLGLVERGLFKKEKVLTAGTGKTMCVRKDATWYAINDELTANCTTMTVKSEDSQHGHGAFFPVATSLYFYPESHNCGQPTNFNYLDFCPAAEYDLNIFPSAGDRELHATPGSKLEAAAAKKRSDDAAFAQLVRAFGKAMAEEKQRQANAAANARTAQEKQLRDQAAAREERNRQILAADAAGDPNAKVPAQMIRRDEEDSRQRWSGSRQSPAAYDPKWMGQNVTVTGTVSRVEVDPNGSPNWVTIYFKESPDSTFVVCSPYADLFQERIGMDLSALVGKTFEAAGPVESPYCGPKAAKGSIRVVESKQWTVK